MIAIACDHGGIELKQEIMNHLKEKGIEFKDFGTNDSTSVDYPDYASKVCEAILSGEAESGILVCGSGIGMSIAANRYKGIRAALVYNAECATLSRQHNNANIICFGNRLVNHEEAIKYLDIFMTTEFEGGRHCGRIEKLDKEN